MSRSLALALLLPALMLVPLAAFGDGEKTPPKKKLPPAATDVKYDPEGVVAISEFQEQVAKGNARYAEKDYTGAVDLYRKAIQLAPKNALGPYLLAEAHLATGNLAEADASIASAVELAPTDAKPTSQATRARVLFLRADIYERQKKWEQAKTAWQAYTDAANKVTSDGGAYPASGQERVRAIQKAMDLEKQYVPVRERIAADKADAGKAATPPKKK
jgi:tetratricopeptide (TPR) repeat protein